MDANYPGSGDWNVVVGESFDVKNCFLLFSLSIMNINFLQVNCGYDEGSKMMLFFAGTLGVFIWKCSM